MDWQEISDNHEKLGEIKNHENFMRKDDFDSTILSPQSLANLEANTNLCKDYMKSMENRLQFYKSLKLNMDSWSSPQEAEYESLQRKLESATQLMQLLKEKREKVEKLKQERQASYAEIGVGVTNSKDFIQLHQQQEKRLTDAKFNFKICKTSTEDLREEIFHLKQQHQYLQQKNEMQQKLQQKEDCKKQLAASRLKDNIERLKTFLDIYKKNGNLRLDSRCGDLINIELCNQAEDKDLPQLFVSTTMEQDNLGYMRAIEAQVSDQNVHADDLLQMAVHRDDLPQLFNILQTRWKTFFPFASEMKNVAEKHAVDWIQNKNLVRILVGKRISFMCTLHVPETYPFSGEITLVETTGLPNGVTKEEIQPPPGKRGLQGWLDYLEDLFGKP